MDVVEFAQALAGLDEWASKGKSWNERQSFRHRTAKGDQRMSQAAVEQVMGRLVLDRAFRAQVVADPAQALAEFDLTVEERQGFTALDLAEFDRGASELEERVSKGQGWN